MSNPDSNPTAGAELAYWWSPRGDERVFELPNWPAESRELARSLLLSSDVDHRWEAEKIVVPASARDEAAALLDEIIAASAEKLDGDSDRVAYELADWPPHEIDIVLTSLSESGIAHSFTEDAELLVYEGDEETVDALFEQLGLHGPNPGVEVDGETLTSLLDALYLASDKLARNANDPDGVVAAVGAAQELETLAVPFGFDHHAWQRMVDEASELSTILEEADDNSTDDDVSGRARALHETLRPWL